MTARELPKAVRRAYRDRYGEVSDRLDPDEAAEFLADAEAELGFRLPKLVRVVFTHAGRGFIDLDWGVSKYRERYHEGKAPDSVGYWPPRMLPVKALGTDSEADWLCVDCSAGAGPVYVFYDNWDSADPCWPGMFEPVSASLEDFLYGFLQGGDFPPGRANPDDPYGRA